MKLSTKLGMAAFAVLGCFDSPVAWVGALIGLMVAADEILKNEDLKENDD